MSSTTTVARCCKGLDKRGRAGCTTNADIVVQAARLHLAYLEAGKDPQDLMTAARRLIFSKGTNSHDYKFSSAALEDFYHVTPAWRNRFLASSMFNLRGSGDKDNDLVKRTRAALGG